MLRENFICIRISRVKKGRVVRNEKEGKDNMRKIFIAIVTVLCTSGASWALTGTTACIVYQCGDGYFADNGFYDYNSGQTVYTKCTKCPGKTLANGGAARVRTWELYVRYLDEGGGGVLMRSLPPMKPLERSACYISSYDNQTFQDNTGKWQYYGGGCKY